ncbi:MAG: ABC transporter ATP-binding protein, partial [Clostridia bacterium]|nr:ABC transporter ATP-binding protein [Clostridia bacterium]
TDVLILDEPLANLDAATAEKIEDLLLSIKNKTLLVVSHQFTAEKLSAFDSVVNFNMANS